MWNVNVRGLVAMEATKNKMMAEGCIIMEVTSIFDCWYGITFNKPAK